MECLWKITVKSGHYVALSFHFMEVESYKGKCIDVVEVKDGEDISSELLGESLKLSARVTTHSFAKLIAHSRFSWQCEPRLQSVHTNMMSLFPWMSGTESSEVSEGVHACIRRHQTVVFRSHKVLLKSKTTFYSGRWKQKNCSGSRVRNPR